jgi:hypothetical protein
VNKLYKSHIRHVTGYSNNHALLHYLVLSTFVDCHTNRNSNWVSLWNAIWSCYVALYARWTTISSASAATSERLQPFSITHTNSLYITENTHAGNCLRHFHPYVRVSSSQTTWTRGNGCHDNHGVTHSVTYPIILSHQAYQVEDMLATLWLDGTVLLGSLCTELLYQDLKEFYVEVINSLISC